MYCGRSFPPISEELAVRCVRTRGGLRLLENGRAIQPTRKLSDPKGFGARGEWFCASPASACALGRIDHAQTEAADAMASGETMTIDGKTVKVKSQKKITLADQMEMRDRQDLYRNYLLYCMSGDSVDLPMGASVVIERDQTEFLRLSQLGDVLGLTQARSARSLNSEAASQQRLRIFFVGRFFVLRVPGLIEWSPWGAAADADVLAEFTSCVCGHACGCECSIF